MQSSVKEMFQHLADTLTFQLGWDRLSLDLSDAEVMEQLEYGRDDDEAGDAGASDDALASPPTSTLHH